MYKIINKITNNTSYYNNDIEQGLALDVILDNLYYKYPFLNITFMTKGNDIIIMEVKR